jgi:hypothetical protein
MKSYDYNVLNTKNDKVNLDKLKIEIDESEITISLSHITQSSSIFSIVFRAELSTEEISILDNIVINHDGEPINNEIPQNVKIIEESGSNGVSKTQGYYRATSFVIDVGDTTGMYTKELSFPYHISIASAQWFCNEENIGDEASFVVAPEIPIGTIISGATSGDTTIYVSDSVIENIKYGFYIHINGDFAGHVYDIDLIHNVITIDNPISDNYPVGEIVKMCIPVVDGIDQQQVYTF